MVFNVTEISVPDDIGDGSNGKRHVYAIVEGESPISTPPSTPPGKEQIKFGRKVPNIFPRKNSLINEDSISEANENHLYETASNPCFENGQNFGFNRVTLI